MQNGYKNIALLLLHINIQKQMNRVAEAWKTLSFQEIVDSLVYYGYKVIVIFCTVPSPDAHT